MSYNFKQLRGLPKNFGLEIGFVRAPFPTVAGAYHELLGVDNVLYNESALGLERSAEKLLPLQKVGIDRNLLVSTGGDWVAHFDSSAHGGDPRSPCSAIGRKLNADVVLLGNAPFGDSPHELSASLGLVQFEYYFDWDAVNSGEGFRSISLIEMNRHPSKCEFLLQGPVQPWESTEKYRLRRKRDKFTPETLEKYCQELGIDPFNLDFYRGPSALFKRTQ